MCTFLPLLLHVLKIERFSIRQLLCLVLLATVSRQSLEEKFNILPFRSIELLKCSIRQQLPYLSRQIAQLLCFFPACLVYSLLYFIFLQWDPMITTLPGLYLSTVAVLAPLEWLFAIPMYKTCTVLFLRFINTVFATGNILLLFGISKVNTQHVQVGLE